jgi:hypothetical protein
MRTIILATGMALGLAGCAASGPPTAWGKPGVSRIDYGTDIGVCSGTAAQAYAGNGANSNTGAALPDPLRQKVDATTNTVPATAAGQSNSLPASGTYSGTASADYAQRAAMQQRTQEMMAKRAQENAFRSCIAQKGYSEFALTPEQRAHLATLKSGSNEYHEYLYKLGSNPPAATAAK